MRRADWPNRDRQAWERALLASHGPFRSNGGGRTRSPYTIRNAEQGYGRWLTFLAHIGELELDEAPPQRVTLDRLDKYFRYLQEHGNGVNTVINRFNSLRRALAWMCPSADVRYITKPQGQPLRSLLPIRRKAMLVPDSVALGAWAQALFKEGLLLHKRRARCAQIRAAVMIAILTERAPRLRALTALRIGVHLRRIGDEWMLDQTVDITKMREPNYLPLSPEVAAMLDRYLAIERQELLHGHTSDALWICWHGTALAQDSISRTIRARSKRRFGRPFGPHAFRHALATTAALYDPEHPLDASLILGHRSPQTTLAHYNRATAVMAARRQSARIKRLRGG